MESIRLENPSAPPCDQAAAPLDRRPVAAGPTGAMAAPECMALAGHGLGSICTTSQPSGPLRVRLLRRLAVLQRRERQRGRQIQPRFRLTQIGVTFLGCLCAVAVLALLSVWSGQLLIVAPLGASSVLLFGYPRSPLAQPRNVILGNTLGGSIGVVLVTLLGQGPLVLALAVALTILLGQQFRCLHPPAGGMAFLAAFLGVSWHFLLFPVLSGSLLLVLMAWAFSRWIPRAMRYPLHWL